MSYRPQCDVWILARPKVKYHGAFPNGFLERARALLGVQPDDPVLHVCGGKTKDYPRWRERWPNDMTLDMDASLKPDFVQDALEPLPPAYHSNDPTIADRLWLAILCDPPYTEADASHYATHFSDRRGLCPSANALLKNALQSVRVGGRVGMLNYVWPQPPKVGVKCVACVAVIAGYNNRMRCYSVYERTA